MKSTRDFFAIAVIVIGLTLPIKVVSAQGLPPGQLPELTGEWWQWALSIPASVNPNLVQPGDDTCMIGQRGPHMADQSLDFCWRQIFTLPTVFRVGSTTYPMPVNRYCSQNSRFRHHKPPLKSRRKSRAESATARNLDRLRTVRASSGRKGYNWSEPLACSLSTLVVRGGAVAWTTRHRLAL